MGHQPIQVAVVGTAGVPAAYGGFETLAENLVRFNSELVGGPTLTVYCSSVGRPDLPAQFGKAKLAYVHLKPNGLQSIAYDVLSIASAIRSGQDVILLLGVSGAICLPFVRLFTGIRILTNIDGIEWRRAKWNRLARLVLRLSEWIAVRWSHVVIADNAAIAEYVRASYGADCDVIAYGGDHALEPRDEITKPSPYGKGYALALCRIEPENNVEMILAAWATTASSSKLIFVGNWNNSSYGRELAERYAGAANIEIVHPVYEPRSLKAIRSGASLYVHGHSAGGTNPSLVEMMHFGIPIAAFDCSFNRNTTLHAALYFADKSELSDLLGQIENSGGAAMGAQMKKIASENYTWEKIGSAYLKLFERKPGGQPRTHRQ